MKEYWELKKKVQEQSRGQLTTLNSINRKQKDDQETLDSLSRKKLDLDSRIRQMTHEMSETTKRVEKLGEQIKLYETSLYEQRRTFAELKIDVINSKGIINLYNPSKCYETYL